MHVTDAEDINPFLSAGETSIPMLSTPKYVVTKRPTMGQIGMKLADVNFSNILQSPNSKN